MNWYQYIDTIHQMQTNEQRVHRVKSSNWSQRHLTGAGKDNVKPINHTFNLKCIMKIIIHNCLVINFWGLWNLSYHLCMFEADERWKWHTMFYTRHELTRFGVYYTHTHTRTVYPSATFFPNSNGSAWHIVRALYECVCVCVVLRIVMSSSDKFACDKLTSEALFSKCFEFAEAEIYSEFEFCLWLLANSFHNYDLNFICRFLF